MIPESFLEELRQRSDIEQVISSYVLLKRAGRNLKGLCPFHSEKSPSFVVYPENQSFYCFGCGAGGDVITFIRRAENLEYVEAVKFLAERAGMRLPEDVAEDRTAHLRLRILEMNRIAARFFHKQLVSGADKSGLEYLAARGMTRQMLTKFGLGYAPNSWNSLCDHLREQGFSYEEMQQAALVSSRNGKSYYDAFRGRVMFPIIDLRGNVVGFGGRILGEGGPKYLNSADTPAFKKSRNLFAMNFAKTTKEPRLILAEGYMDVISIYQAGFDNAVATLGTALTGEQARLISQYHNEVLIAYDSDGPGQAATRRAVKLFDEIGVKVKVLRMQGAKDPDEYIKKFGATRFKLLMDESSSSTEFEIEKLRERYDITTDDGRVRFLSDFAQLIAGLNNPIEQDVYIGKWSGELGVSREAVAEQVKNIGRRKAASQRKKQQSDLSIYGQQIEINKKDTQRAKYLPYALAEDKLLAALLKNNDYYPLVAKQITPEEFVTDSNRQLFAAVMQRLQENKNTDIIGFAGVLEEPLLARLSWLLAENEGQRFTTEQVREYITKIQSFRQHRDAAQVGTMSTEEYTDYIRQLAQNKRK